MKNDTHLDLVEHLAQAVGCRYISDLRFMAADGSEEITAALMQLTQQDYSLRDWNDALMYLVQQPEQESIEAAYALLVQSLFARRR